MSILMPLRCGGGMVTEYDWASVNWPIDMPEIADQHINVKETMAIVTAVRRWALHWANCKVVIHTDNVTAKAHVNRRA